MTDSDRDARRLWSRKVHGLTPYVPGEQPRDRAYIKLNTNENPYPPAPGVVEAIQTFPVERLKLYPRSDWTCDPHSPGRLSRRNPGAGFCRQWLG